MIWIDGTDLGSIENTGSIDNRWNFQFLTADFAKLPKDVAPGSTAMNLTTGDLYIFHKQTATWIKQ